MKTRQTVTIGTLAAFVGYCAYAIAGGNQLVLTGYFEGGAEPGRFVYQDDPRGGGLLIDYYSPSLKKKFSYRVEKYDECSSMAMYAIPNTHQVAIDGSCASQGGQIYVYIYKWNEAENNWCLIREITGQRADISSGMVSPSEQVSRVKNCVFPGASAPYSYEPESETAREVAYELRQFRNSTKEKEALKEFLRQLPSYSVSELVTYVSPKNVQDMNDLAYYLSENGRSYDVIPLLEKISNDFPKRVVAKLNLADAYWENDYKERGAALYRKYYEEMISENLESKIPDRVFSRMKK